MGEFVLKPEITIGNILTLVSIAFSIVGLLFAWAKDRKLRRTEYADRIRRAAGTIIAKLDRRRELATRYFFDIQPLLTDADSMLVKEQDIIAVRDFLWRGLVAIYTESSQRILDEQIEIAYTDLYGYDPDIQSLFSEAINRLRAVDRAIFALVLDLTQQDVLLQEGKETFHSAHLGNALRETCGEIAAEYGSLIKEMIILFRREMVKLIEANDNDILNRKVDVLTPDEVFSSSVEHRIDKAIRVIKEHITNRRILVETLRRSYTVFSDLNHSRCRHLFRDIDLSNEVDSSSIEHRVDETIRIAKERITNKKIRAEMLRAEMLRRLHADLSDSYSGHYRNALQVTSRASRLMMIDSSYRNIASLLKASESLKQGLAAWVLQNDSSFEVGDIDLPNEVDSSSVDLDLSKLIRRPLDDLSPRFIDKLDVPFRPGISSRVNRSLLKEMAWKAWRRPRKKKRNRLQGDV